MAIDPTLLVPIVSPPSPIVPLLSPPSPKDNTSPQSSILSAHNSTPTITSSTASKNSDSDPKVSWLGRVVKWIKTTILDPIGRFFKSLFSDETPDIDHLLDKPTNKSEKREDFTSLNLTSFDCPRPAPLQSLLPNKGAQGNLPPMLPLYLRRNPLLVSVKTFDAPASLAPATLALNFIGPAIKPKPLDSSDALLVENIPDAEPQRPMTKKLPLNPTLNACKETLRFIAENAAFDAMLTPQPDGKNKNIEQLRNHIAALVNYMRGDTTIQPTHADLPVIEMLARRLKCNLGNDPILNLTYLIELFGGDREVSMDIIYSLMIQEFPIPVNQLLKRPAALADANAIQDDAFIDLQKMHPSLAHVLKFISEMHECDSLLVSPMIPLSRHKDDLFLPFTYKTEMFTQLYDLLQSHLAGMVHTLRTGEKLKEDDFQHLQLLLRTLNIDINDPIKCLHGLFNIFEPKNAFIPLYVQLLKFSIIRPYCLNAPSTIGPATNTVIFPRLSNLGATCYLDSSLWMMARISSFDTLLTSTIPEPNTDDSQEVIKYHIRIALQGHLAAIINKIRTKQKIDRINLEVLYSLLELAGWDRSRASMQDPSEFIQEVTNFMGVEAEIATSSKYERTKKGDTSALKVVWAQDRHLAIDLSLPYQGTKVKNLKLNPHITSMEELLNVFCHEPARPEYSEEPDGVQIETNRFFTEDTPDTLFVHAMRFGRDKSISKSTFRLGFDLPIFKDESDATLSIPIFTKVVDGEPVLKEMRVYKLKSAICHEGGQSAESGHYTALVLQQHEGVDTWIQYDDLGKPDELTGYKMNKDRDAQKLKQFINTSGYYLAYELEKVIPASDLDTTS